jgi:DNA-nicking Smr family endonuclease
MGVHTALDALNAFMIRALRENQQAVLIVHGRGLSSPRTPVLKARVEEWLRRSAWRKWVLAFSSARGCDGGTGATYVLLRQRPATRRFRKSAARNQAGACKK